MNKKNVCEREPEPELQRIKEKKWRKNSSSSSNNDDDDEENKLSHEDYSQHTWLELFFGCDGGRKKHTHTYNTWHW